MEEDKSSDLEDEETKKKEVGDEALPSTPEQETQAGDEAGGTGDVGSEETPPPVPPRDEEFEASEASEAPPVPPIDDKGKEEEDESFEDEQPPAPLGWEESTASEEESEAPPAAFQELSPGLPPEPRPGVPEREGASRRLEPVEMEEVTEDIPLITGQVPPTNLKNVQDTVDTCLGQISQRSKAFLAHEGLGDPAAIIRNARASADQIRNQADIRGRKADIKEVYKDGLADLKAQKQGLEGAIEVLNANVNKTEDDKKMIEALGAELMMFDSMMDAYKEEFQEQTNFLPNPAALQKLIDKGGVFKDGTPLDPNVPLEEQWQGKDKAVLKVGDSEVTRDGNTYTSNDPEALADVFMAIGKPVTLFGKKAKEVARILEDRGFEHEIKFRGSVKKKPSIPQTLKKQIDTRDQHVWKDRRHVAKNAPKIMAIAGLNASKKAAGLTDLDAPPNMTAMEKNKAIWDQIEGVAQSDEFKNMPTIPFHSRCPADKIRHEMINHTDSLKSPQDKADFAKEMMPAPLNATDSKNERDSKVKQNAKFLEDFCKKFVTGKEKDVFCHALIKGSNKVDGDIVPKLPKSMKNAADKGEAVGPPPIARGGSVGQG